MLGQRLQKATTEQEMREVAARICRNYLHGLWKTVAPSDLEFRKISGGLSNYLYYVALPDETAKWNQGRTDEKSGELSNSPDVEDKNQLFSFDEPRQVLLRIYGQVHGERAMDTIVTESVIFTLLSERKLGPKLYGVFSGGRIEEYIPARCLLQKELADPSISMKLAEKMAAIHSMNIPLSKEPTWLWKTMARWLKEMKYESFPGIKPKTAEEQQIQKRIKLIDFDKEIDWLKMYLATVDSPIVFCHNDLQEGNILLLGTLVDTATDDYENYTAPTPVKETYIDKNSFDTYEARTSTSCKRRASGTRESFEETYEDNTRDSITSHLSDTDGPQLVLIDFEYCAYNYRGFDIANHFNEWMYDYKVPNFPFYTEDIECLPTLEQKEIFIKEYLKCYHINQAEQDASTPGPTIDAVNKLLGEVEAHNLASHLFWAIWGIVQAGSSQIEFGYWQYAVSRLDMFLQLKNEVIKRDSGSAPQKRKICEVDI